MNLLYILFPIYMLNVMGNEGIKGKTRFQKIAFLIQEQLQGKIDLELEFEAAPYGPYSFILSESIKNLCNKNLMKEHVIGVKKTLHVFSLTDDGTKLLKEYENIIPIEVKKATKNTIKAFGDMPLDELLDFVHEEYPNLLLK